ncbi:hypothetical protein CKO_03892 [Citrobacter koseri ATCC BAA-895]|uniref:Uncharacterized protein n=1 Tax=Citrobacter koseri (strain ATCC BAA-895 / CDC 4225-83 / SGSC4696) TaxID=290338 RepID=A8ANA5_CITK8|nr:hypothetical protein CKO_03892 [Citrobacter koseri ATCC BAA-895]
MALRLPGLQMVRPVGRIRRSAAIRQKSDISVIRADIIIGFFYKIIPVVCAIPQKFILSLILK